MKKIILASLLVCSVNIFAGEKKSACGDGYFQASTYHQKSSFSIGDVKFENLTTDEIKLILLVRASSKSFCVTQEADGELRINN